MSVDAFSRDSKGLSTETLTVTVPAFREYCKNRQVLTVTASYTLDGKTVSSQRKWTVQGGDFTDEPLPTYDWLIEENTEPVTQPSETTAEPDTSEIVTTEALPSDTGLSQTTAATTDPTSGKGCSSTISALSALSAMTLAGCGLAVCKKKKKR